MKGKPAVCHLEIVTLFVIGFFALSPLFAYGQIPTVPLHRFVELKNDRYHFYTADQDEAASLKTKPNWQYWGVVGYVFSAAKHPNNTVPLYHLYKSEFAQNNHFYTLDKAEYDTAAASLGWTGLGICCYVSPSQIAGTLPLMRMYKDCKVPNDGKFRSGCQDAIGGDGHFYTTNGKEKFDFMSKGYRFVRNEGFIWDQPFTTEPPVRIDTSGSKAANPDTVLLNLDCNRQAVNEYKCYSQRGYETCQSYMQSGKVKNCSLSATVNPKIQEAIDKALFTVGCSRFLGRADEFMCKTQRGLDLCETYHKNGKVKKCMMAKG